MDRFKLDSTETQNAPGENIAPTQQIPLILNEAPTSLSVARWGLVPSWAKEIKVGSRMFNARAETLDEKPAFRAAFKRRRCLIPSDGFYEWRTEPDGRKTPVQYTLRSHEPFAFAGLWELWKPPDGGDWLRTCTIITTEANDLVRKVHDRMPVILLPEYEEAWMAAPEDASEPLLSLLQPYPPERMTASDVPPGVLGPVRGASRSKAAQLPLDSL